MLLLASLNCQAAGSDQVIVTVMANIRETTCDISLTADNLQGGNAITFGSDLNGIVRDTDILDGTAASETHFSLNITTCPVGVSVIKTRFNATSIPGSTTIINNSLGQSNEVGVVLYREGEEANLFSLNSNNDADILVWRANEISQQRVDLAARLIAVGGSIAGLSLGTFSAPLVMQFSYE